MHNGNLHKIYVTQNVYYSEVTLLLQCFIFLFKPMKNIYLTIIKRDIFENTFGRTCPKGSMQHSHLYQKGGASVRK